MPPLPPSQHNSRSALITSLVVFVVLFITATVFALYFNTQWKAADKIAHDAVLKMQPAITDEEFSDPHYLRLLGDPAAKKGSSVLRVALDQRDYIAKVVTGNPAAPNDAIAADTTRTINSVKDDLKNATVSGDVAGTIKEDDLLRDLKVLSGQLVVLNQAVDAATTAKKAAEDKLNAEIATRNAALDDKGKAVEEAAKSAADTKKQSDDREQTQAATLKTVNDSSNKAIQDAQQQTALAQAELTKVAGTVKKLEDLIARLKVQLGAYRLDPSKSLMRPAGMIARVPGNDTVYINLGEGESISPGLTFEVYSKRKGLPNLTADTNLNATVNLPDGKASIEVVRVLAGTSECRVIKSNPALPIVEGDLILNIVWNAHANKFNFVVFGNFDLAQTGQATPGDAEVIRRLVTQWGGRLTDQVDVDTDFVVLGKEPATPVKPESPTPLDDQRFERDTKTFEAYHAILARAVQLNIPVLNQDRFLFFVGYYDQAKR